jgi:hypothetical protein
LNALNKQASSSAVHLLACRLVPRTSTGTG